MTALLDLQKDFMAALMQPLTGEDRAGTPFAALALAENSRPRERVLAHLTPSEKLGPRERFSLYHRQYWYRIIDSIAEDFPRTRGLLGEDVFWLCVEQYLIANPPRDSTLLSLGWAFADFLLHANAVRPEARLWANALACAEYAKLSVFAAGESVVPETLDRIRPAPAVWYAVTDAKVVTMLESENADIVLPNQPPGPSTLIVVGRLQDGSVTVTKEKIQFLPLLEHLSRQKPLSLFFLENADKVQNWTEAEVQDFFRRWNQSGWFTAWGSEPHA